MQPDTSIYLPGARDEQRGIYLVLFFRGDRERKKRAPPAPFTTEEDMLRADGGSILRTESGRFVRPGVAIALPRALSQYVV